MANGWLVNLLEKVAAQDTRPPTAAETRVVEMPRDLNRLKAEIRKANSELVQVQGQRSKIALAWEELEREHAELLANNDQQQRNIIARMSELQRQLAEAVKECGIQATVIEATVSES